MNNKTFRIKENDKYSKEYKTESVVNNNNGEHEPSSLKIFDKKKFNQEVGDDYNFVAEYKKSHKDKYNGVLSFTDCSTKNSRSINCYRYGSFNRLFCKEVGYAEVEDTENGYVVFLRNRIFPFILSLLLLLGLLFGVYSFLNNEPNINNDEYHLADTLPGEIEGIDKDELQKILNAQVKENMAQVSVNSSIVCVKKGCPNANIVNAKENKKYQMITYILEDGTEIAKTDLIAPGTYLKKIELNKELDLGKYNVNAIASTFQKNKDGKFEKTGQVAKIPMTIEVR